MYDSSLIALLDEVETSGRYVMQLAPGEHARSKAKAKEHIAGLLYDFQFATLRLDLVKSFIDDIELKVSNATVKGDGDSLSFNLLKVLMLPCLSPEQELKDMRQLLVHLRSVHQKYPTERCSVQLVNNRDSHRRVYGSIPFRRAEPGSTTNMVVDNVESKIIADMVDASPGLTHWLRQTALELQRLGPWSQAVITENCLFSYGQSPYAKHFRAEREAAKKLNPPSEPEELITLDV